MTEEERNILQQYLDTYSDVVARIRTALKKKKKRLNGIDPEPESEKEYIPSPAEKAYAKISSVMKSLKREMKKVKLVISSHA